MQGLSTSVMNKFLILLALIIPLNSEAQFANWSPTDKALLATSTALLVADWGQTRYIAKNPDRFHEKNPLLGKHPSVGEVDGYFVTAIIGNYLLADVIGPTNRKWYLGGVTAMETVVVIRNRGIGIKISF